MALRIAIRGNGISRMEEAVRVLGEKRAHVAFRRAINEAGRDTKTPTQRALAKQTGLKVGVTRRALRDTKASTASLEYKLEGKGGDIGLKYFGAREVRAGVSAAPFGKRSIWMGRFIKGGHFPNRKTLAMNGHVFKARYGDKSWGRKFEKQKSGVFIPKEMVKGVTAETFERIGTGKLAEKVERHIKLATKGVLS